MTPRERIMTTLAHRQPDRVPIGFDAHDGLLQRLLAHYGAADRLSLFKAMGIDWFDYSGIRERCDAIHELGLPTVGGEGGCGIQHAINLRGYEQALMDPLVDPAFTHAYMERMGDFFAPGGGYILGGSQVLLDNLPLANVVAMFESAVELGRY